VNVFSYKGILLVVLLVAAAFLFVSEINSNPLFLSFNPQNVGSFEYVRAGERFLDKGLYLKAISCYERAYEASSENASIESNVIYAYSKYALVLADSAKYDEAIEYLTKAYNIRQDPSTIQNLAIMYTRKALPFAQKEDFKKAMELFGEARRIAYGSYSAARNLGISLSNDGIVEFRQGRDDAALLCLKESSLVYQYGRTFLFLGDVYYKKGELRRALFYWHRAKYLDPGDRSIPPKLKRVIKEIRLANSEREIELPHFEVKYKNSLSIDANLTASILEKAYFEIGKDLAYFPKTKTGVFLYSNNDFRNIFKMPAAVRAFYDGNIRMPIPDERLEHEEFLRHVYHEYTHALLSAKTMNNCPVWLGEGVAMWEEFNKSGCNPRALPISAETLNDTTLESLDKEFDSNEIGPNRAMCYLISYTIVAYIIDGWGMEGLQDILKRLANGQHVVNAIDDEFLLSEKEFERKWKAYVRNKYLLKFSNVS
jgi:tetratricopeptide (TPR) repeat protein